jgi:hypothetical protein
MNSETNPPITRQEAASALDEIDRVRHRVRKTLAAGIMSSMLVLWGVLWIAGFTAEQFVPNAYRVWLALDVIGIAISLALVVRSRRSPAQGTGPGHGRIGASWLILFGYAVLWCYLLVPYGLLNGSGWAAYGPVLERKMALLWVTVCMLAYVLMGLWLDRFLLWLGAVVTLAALVGFLFVQPYFFLWVAVTGGGSLVVSGLFIRKVWGTNHA